MLPRCRNLNHKWCGQSSNSRKPDQNYRDAIQQQMFKKSYTGTIRGIVKDSEGNPVSGARISFRSATSTQTFDVVSNYMGEYEITGLPASTMRLLWSILNIIRLTKNSHPI